VQQRWQEIKKLTFIHTVLPALSANTVIRLSKEPANHQSRWRDSLKRRLRTKSSRISVQTAIQ
jgi:hypothetical protein